MRGSRAALAALFGLALVGLNFIGCVSAPEPAAPPPRAERPVYELGEKWIRNDGLYELTRIDEGRYVFSGGAGREIRLTRDLVVGEVTGPRFLQFLSPPLLSWPLQLGQKSSSLGLVTSHAAVLGGSGQLQTTLTVDRYEEVRVPAGTFKAFRISGAVEGYYVPLGGHVFRAWYAPDARQLVKAESLTLTPLNFQVVALDPSGRTGARPSRSPWRSRPTRRG